MIKNEYYLIQKKNISWTVASDPVTYKLANNNNSMKAIQILLTCNKNQHVNVHHRLKQNFRRLDKIEFQEHKEKILKNKYYTWENKIKGS